MAQVVTFQGIGDAIITVTKREMTAIIAGATTTLTVNSVSVLTKTEEFLLLTSYVNKYRQ
jgi:hypothetical protein